MCIYAPFFVYESVYESYFYSYSSVRSSVLRLCIGVHTHAL